jgi:hypothetical protein
MAHGFWDLFHHRHGPYADTPHWYIPFCVVYDWILGDVLAGLVVVRMLRRAVPDRLKK